MKLVRWGWSTEDAEAPPCYEQGAPLKQRVTDEEVLERWRAPPCYEQGAPLKHCFARH